MPLPIMPADAAVLTVDASTVPTPANRNLRIDVREKSETGQAECDRSTLRMRLVDKARTVVDQLDETSGCSGACTAAEKRWGHAAIAQIERQIETGESSESELDYNYTGCLETGYYGYKKFRNVGGRDVVVFVDRYIGPHSTENHRLRVVTEVCSKLFQSEGFAEHPIHSLELGAVGPQAEGDGALSIYGEYERKVTLLRLHFPACPGVPREETFDVDPLYKSME